MRSLDIVVRGNPKPQSRPRVTVNGTYSNSSDALKAWRRAVRAAASGKAMEAGTLSCVVIIGLANKEKRRHGRLHSARPDFDNLAKAILDALQATERDREAFPLADDSLIASAWIVKVYAPFGFARIILDRIDTIGDACAAITRATETVAALEK